MDKKSQILRVSMAIQELSSLVIAIATNDDYTQEQANNYYNTIFEMHNLEDDEEEE